MMGAALLSGLGLHKAYGQLTVLDAVDVSVARGEALGIVGPNGAGKTTLFGVLAGTLAAGTGRVLFDGADITALPAPLRCRSGIARTHQVPRPFLGMTVFQNALVAAQHGAGLAGAAADNAARTALERCGLLAHADRGAATLGLLDRKRLELARALATQPRVLLLDEIGGGLTEAELGVLVAQIAALKAEGMTIVWIEHVLHALLAVIDRLVCMAGGSVIADGPPQRVMADAGVVSAYLGGAAA